MPNQRTSDQLAPHGAQISDPAIQVQRQDWGFIYRSCEAALVAAGLARPEWFPGKPGNNKVSQYIFFDERGAPVVHARGKGSNPPKKTYDEWISIKVCSKNTFELWKPFPKFDNSFGYWHSWGDSYAITKDGEQIAGPFMNLAYSRTALISELTADASVRFVITRRATEDINVHDRAYWQEQEGGLETVYALLRIGAARITREQMTTSAKLIREAFEAADKELECSGRRQRT